MSSGGAVSAFRAIRLLRIFKLARQWKSFQDMLVKIGRTLKDISNFTVLLFLFMFTYALLFMEIFAYKVFFNADNEPDPHGESPRTNFDDFIHAFTTVFVVIVGEDWNTVMYDYMRTMGRWYALIFLSLVVLGNWLLLNLFLAILLKNFEDSKEEEGEAESASIIKRFSSYTTKVKSLVNKIFGKKPAAIGIESQLHDNPPLEDDKSHPSGVLGEEGKSVRPSAEQEFEEFFGDDPPDQS